MILNIQTIFFLIYKHLKVKINHKPYDVSEFRGVLLTNSVVVLTLQSGSYLNFER